MPEMLPSQAWQDPGPVVYMTEFLDLGGSPGQRRHVRDGWRDPFGGMIGFRHEYDADVATGGWEFHRLQPGLCLAISELTPLQPIPLRHRLSDQLVLSAMITGGILYRDRGGSVAEVGGGHCAVFGVSGDAEVRTVYRPRDALKWVDVYIDRRSFRAVTGVDPAELPAAVGDFLESGASLDCLRMPMPQRVSLAIAQIVDCPYHGGFRRTFLAGKALEIASGVLFAMARRRGGGDRTECWLSARDHARLELAMRLLRQHLDRPLNIPALAARCGLGRQKLQSGFRLLHGDTVARVRDRLRMEHALQRIRGTSVPILDIALEAGYQQATSFARAFRAAYGVSPMRMRMVARSERLPARLERRSA